MYAENDISNDNNQCGGFGSRVNMFYAYKRDLGTNPTARRLALRRPGDEDRYRIEL